MDSNEMNVLIIVFSATGNTSKVAKMMEKALLGQKAGVQVIELQREDVFADAGGIRELLEKRVAPHDCVCVGGPVYADHFQRQAKNIIRALPPPGGKWGAAAVPFVTWGGISSGTALAEAAKLLKDSGRTPVLGMKILALHALSRKYAVRLNEGKPGDEALPCVEELAKRISTLDIGKPDGLKDVSRRLSYQDPMTKIKAALFFSEPALKPIFYPGLKVDPRKCERCGLCVEICPVQCWETSGDLPVEKKNGADCIYCGECFNRCPAGAISFPAARMEWLITNGGRGKGPLACRESPKNAVYPLQ